MVQQLFWLEPKEKWQSRGYANNQWLVVDYGKKQYRYNVGMYNPTEGVNSIKVSSKGSIKDYISYLQRHGFDQLTN